MDYYAGVHKIKTYLNELGFEVDLFSDQLPSDVLGRTYYVERKVLLNCCSAREAFFTILHEAGHVLAYNKYFLRLKQKQPPPEKREVYAYLYGWIVNKQLELGLTKEEWRSQELTSA